MEPIVYSRKEMVLQRSYIEVQEQQITKKTGSAADILNELDHHQRYELFEQEYTKYENGVPLIDSKSSDASVNLRKSRSEGGKMNLLSNRATAEGKKAKVPNGHVVTNGTGASVDPKVATENLKNQQSKVKEAVNKYTTKVAELNDASAVKPTTPTSDSRVRAKSVGSLSKGNKDKKAELVKSRSGSFVNGDFKRNGIFDIAYIRSLSPPPYPRCYWDNDSIDALNAANEQSRNASPVLSSGDRASDLSRNTSPTLSNGDRAKYLASSYTDDEITSQVRKLEQLLDRSSPSLTEKPKKNKSKAKKSSAKEAKERFILADPDDYAPYKSRDSFKLADAEEYGLLRSEEELSRQSYSQPRNATIGGNPPAYEETITKTTAWVTGNTSSVQVEQDSEDKPRGVAIYTKYFGYNGNPNKPPLPHHLHHENHHSHHHHHSPTPSDRSFTKSPGLSSRTHHHDHHHDQLYHPHIWVPTPFAVAEEKKQKSSANQQPARPKAGHQQPAHIAPGQMDEIQVLATTMVDSATTTDVPSRKLAQFREDKNSKSSDKTNAFFDTLVFLGDCFLCHGERP